MSVSLRPPRGAEDITTTKALLAVRERADGLPPEYWQRLIFDRWQTPGFDPVVDAVLAEDPGGAPVGFAVLFNDGGFAAVDPSREGEGIGSQLLGWLESRVRAAGRRRHRPIISGSNLRAASLLQSAGYRPLRSYVRMARELVGPQPDPAWPEGLVVEHPDPVAQGRELHALDDQAFRGSPDYEPHPFPSFRHEHIDPLDPKLSLVARRGEHLVGMALCTPLPEDVGLVDLLAVVPAERGQGLGRALLLGAFGQLARSGRRTAVLDVATDNPRALRLYETAGMHELHRADVLVKPIASA